MTNDAAPSSRPWPVVAAAAVVLLAGLGSWLYLAPAETISPRLDLAAGADGVAYIDDARCADCHRGEYETWTDSHHDLAMQPAGADSVLGDFNDASFSQFGVVSRFFMRGDRYFVSTEGPDGALHDYEIAYTFGVDPLQQFLVAFPGGRLQSLPIAWDTREARWFHLYPDEPIAPDEPLHWTGRYQNWNLMCAACHSTNLRKGYNRGTDGYDTTWAAIDVGCQACHGPGAAHETWARGNSAGDPAPSPAGLTRVFRADDAASEIDTCAPCHSRREQLISPAPADAAFLDGYLPARLASGLYHADGQILDEVYVYGSFVQSKMHAAGVRCSDCHDPHSLTLRAEGNALCTRCHHDNPVDRFPTLEPGSYDSPAHHHHETASPGARCVNCHMPARTYMGVDPRRDHSFRVPRPDLSVALGTPNACTGCHVDRDDQDDDWAADTVRAWSDGPPDRHFAEVIAAGRAGDRTARADLAALAGDRQFPGIVRATALELLRPFGQSGIDSARGALTDDDPLVRATGAGGLNTLPPRARSTLLAPLLQDPIRAVRIEAARSLADLADAGPPAFGAAMAEYMEAQAQLADLPAAHLDMGMVHQRQQDPVQAEAAYRIALRLDPWFTPARLNLATLLNEQRRNQDAESILRDGIERTPDEAELHYSLGLLLAEENRLAEAVSSLAEAAARPPVRPRVYYNYGLALQQSGRLDEAERALREARALDAADPDVLLALTRLLMDQQRWLEAREFAAELVQLVPTAPGPQRLLNDIQLRERRSRP